jgi:PKD repeat protein
VNSTPKKNFFFLILFFLLLPFLAKAITFEPPFQLPTFEELINAIIDFISWVAIAIVPIAIIVAAFYFLTSGGDPEKVRTAKRIIFFTIIGLIIILLARGLPAIIRQIIEGPSGPPPICGNATREAGEECDGADFGGKTCIGLGFVGGVLACNPVCKFDTSGCISPPPNIPPTADARVGSAPNPTGTSVTVTEGATVYFDGSNSSDPDGTIKKYEWDFEDNGTYDWSSTTTGATIHIYSAGSYTARLRITDDDGATTTDTVSITVNPAPPPPNIPPTADARVGSAPNPTGTSVTVTEGATVYFDGSTYSSDSDGTITKYEWNFNGGSYDWSSTTTGKTTYIYSAGSYTAMLQVTDDDGVTATDTVSITVNPAPVLIASITSPSDGQLFLQGASVAFSGSVSGGIPPYTYSWSSNLDGVIRNTLTFNKNNLSLGVHTITFQVTDSAPIPVTKSDSITITITNDVTPPTIQNAKVIPTSGPSGTIFTITADIADPLGLGPTTTMAHIQRPDETDVALVTLYDDGTHGDGAANDGTYGARWNSTGFPSGAYYVDITACDLIRNCGEKENI